MFRLVPEVRTEGGKLDFERLKLSLCEAECFKTIQAPSLGTLRPVPAESVNFDTTENIIIEGGNLAPIGLSAAVGLAHCRAAHHLIKSGEIVSAHHAERRTWARRKDETGRGRGLVA